MQSSRLKQVQEHLCTLNSLCLVLGFDFKQTINGIHPSLVDSKGSKSVSNDTIQQLAVAIQELREVKLQRMQKVKIDLELIVICIQNFVFFFLSGDSCNNLWFGSSKILRLQCWSSGT